MREHGEKEGGDISVRSGPRGEEKREPRQVSLNQDTCHGNKREEVESKCVEAIMDQEHQADKVFRSREQKHSVITNVKT